MNTDIANALLGVKCEPIQSSEPGDSRLAMQHMCSQAHDIVRISSPYLNPSLFDNEELRTALSELARHSRYTEVRILVSHSKAIAEGSHRLLHLSRRLSTSVAMRQLVLPDQELQAEYVLADDCGVIQLASSEHDPASIHFCNRVRNKTLTEQFDHLWHQSHPATELRSLIV
jgi:hypothetical protein